jgi:hypothetical protein
VAAKVKMGGGVKAGQSQIISMTAKFSSVCKCGAFIEPGDSMSYDTLSRKSLCFDCVRRQSQFRQEEREVLDNASKLAETRCHALIDRFRTLRLSQRPLPAEVKDELKSVLCRLKNEFAGKEQVRALIASTFKCKHAGADLSPIRTKYGASCIHCASPILPGELVLYDHHVRRIHCLLCDCMRGF